MKFAMMVLAAGLALAAGGLPAKASDTKTWYAYCEGNRQGDHWAVFSENLWPHPLTEGYGRDVATAAKVFFEARHNVQLDGCAGVNFVDASLAEHSRSRTAQLHRKMGDRVLYFRLPDEALPARRHVDAKVPVDLREVIDAVPQPAVDSAEPQPIFTPHRAER